MQLLRHIERVVDGYALSFFFFHVNYQVLAIYGVSGWVFDEYLMSAYRSVASIDEDIFIIFFLVLILFSRVRRIVEEAEIRSMILVEGFSDS